MKSKKLSKKDQLKYCKLMLNYIKADIKMHGFIAVGFCYVANKVNVPYSAYNHLTEMFPILFEVAKARKEYISTYSWFKYPEGDKIRISVLEETIKILSNY